MAKLIGKHKCRVGDLRAVKVKGPTDRPVDI
jgi:hypothetical protein